MYYVCDICKNFVELIDNGGGQLVCCGQPMEQVEIKTEEEYTEKHLPEVIVEDNKVKVTIGSIEHPMETNHYIQFIAVKFNNKIYRKDLKPNEKPYFEMIIEDYDKLEVFEYCNIHGLWKTEI